MNTKLEKLASAVLTMKEELDVLRDQVEFHNKRAQAEDVLLRARKARNVPDGLKTASIEEFVEKRSELEASSFDHIEKVAGIVDYLEEADDIHLSDEMDDADPADLNDWLRSQI